MARGECDRAGNLMDIAVSESPEFVPRQRELENACREGRKPDTDIPMSNEPEPQAPGILI